MTEEKALSALTVELAETVLEHAPTAIYVSAVDDRELLYVNSRAREVFLRDPRGKRITCYQAAGFDRPCPFCRVEQMGVEALLVRRFRHPVSGRTFQLSGKLVDWNGRPAHIEYILDVTQSQQEDDQAQAVRQELETTNRKMENIINAIPGGVALYKVSDVFQTVYFSDGVPGLSGQSTEEYRAMTRQDAAEVVYPGDRDMVIRRAREVIGTRGTASVEFRRLHKDGHVVWIRAQMTWVGEEDGYSLLHCVYHNISDLKETQLELGHMLNAIPGGIASFQVLDGRLQPIYISEGLLTLYDMTREELEQTARTNPDGLIHEGDRRRVRAAVKAALGKGEAFTISYRIRQRDGSLTWVHLDGRQMDPVPGGRRIYAVFTGMSAESRLFQSIADETEDGIYVIDRENYDLLYVNDAKELLKDGGEWAERKCYAALFNLKEPCSFCTLKCHAPDGTAHEMAVPELGRVYLTRFRETDWNGIPAYVKYLQDVTEEMSTHREKERLEQYFKTTVNYLPGGVAVVRREKDGRLIPEFVSDGFAAMTGMTPEEVWALYRRDAMAGVHPDDRSRVLEAMADFIGGDRRHTELTYRLFKGNGDYLCVKNRLSMMQSEGGECRVYASYHDMTREREEQERLRQQYNDLILRHYRVLGPNTLIVGHCNITQNKIMEIVDYTDSRLLETFGSVREEFFAGIGSLVVDEGERQSFLDAYLNAPALAAFRQGVTETIRNCFIRMPHMDQGRYVEFKVHMVEVPDTGDITGILTVTDITEQILSSRILHRLSMSNYDLVVDVDLDRDTYVLLAGEGTEEPSSGRHSLRVQDDLQFRVLPKDRKQVARMLDADYLLKRLRAEGSFTFPYAMTGKDGEIRTKTLTVSAVDLELKRVCLARTDVTDSVREQQELLNVIVYSCELLVFIDVATRRLTMYTQQIVLESLSPYVAEDYNVSLAHMRGFFDVGVEERTARERFSLDNILESLAQKPDGYDFMLPYRSLDGLRYKQINVLWGDRNHKTVCMMRADVTEMLAAERESQAALEKALSQAEEASRAKSDFLSSMSHDIRTPMNAIMGMTALAVAHLDDRSRVEDCLKKISLSSQHLLSLINDILDMSKIERSKISLNRMLVSLPDLMEQLLDIMAPQARSAGLVLELALGKLAHPSFYGDPLRLNQILINLLGNAVKFTPEGGRVDVGVEELPAPGETVRYRFTVSDTGVGMTEEFLSQVFEPFARSRSAVRVEGSGLGLSITKGLVDLMEGDLSVESRVHRGTTFRVELAFEAAGEGEAAPQPEPEAAGSGLEQVLDRRRFLVAEDNPINAEILRELLEMHGARVEVRGDGAQTVQAFRSAAPGGYDAILMDIQMPGMNGYEATRAIRSLDRPDGALIPIVAMTANAFAEDVQASLEAGMTAHVAKPIDMQILLTTLKQVLGKDKNEKKKSGGRRP